MEEMRKSAPELAEDTKKQIKNRKRARRRVIFRRVVTCILAFFVLIELAVGYFGLRYTKKLLVGMPTLNVQDFISEESSRIFDSRGELLTEIGTYYRENITYEDCPESLIDAFLATEDSRYFQHNGFDVPRFTKAVFETFAKHNMQGGSTFTMQLVKNTYFSIDAGDESVERDATIQYKVQQIILAMQLEMKVNKKRIFELYINKLNFGDRIRGVQKAAEYYFGKNVHELNLSESALLAGIINLPNGYNPYHFLDAATARRNEVLGYMLMHGYITEEEEKLARAIKVEDQLVGQDQLNVEKTVYPEYVDVVIEEAQKVTGFDPVTKGMDIYTALNPQIQDQVEAIEAGETSVSFPDDLMQVAMVCMNNQNGEVVAIGGGRNYGDNGGSRLLNRATSQYKQPGSSVKPFLDYALAFEYLGYSIDEILLDKPITFPGESRVLVNFNGEYMGDVTIKEAVARSLNIPAILTLENVVAKIGSEKVVDYLNTIGLSRANDEEFHMSYAIGGNLLETTVMEMAGAHAALINLGTYNQPHTITRIEMSTGEIISPPNQNIDVLSSGSAYLADLLMQNNVEGGIYNYMQILKRSYPVYAKTGTTDWGTDGKPYGIPEGAAKDKWMISSTSQYTNAVWIGYDMAVKNEGTYFPAWKSALNIPGRVNSLLLDIEAEMSPDTLGGVQKPEDVVDVRYIRGTYPHVISDNDSGSMITSMVSETGLQNQPMVSSSAYTRGIPELSGFAASVSNGLVYMSWYTQEGCNGGEEGGRNISLHDPWNDIDMYGSCLVDTSWLNGSRNKYIADIYQDDEYVTTVTSDHKDYAGLPYRFTGEVKACGYFTNGRGTSDTICTSMGYFNADEAEAEGE